jgi:hypothetical protein
VQQKAVPGNNKLKREQMSGVTKPDFSKLMIMFVFILLHPRGIIISAHHSNRTQQPNQESITEGKRQ